MVGLATGTARLSCVLLLTLIISQLVVVLVVCLALPRLVVKIVDLKLQRLILLLNVDFVIVIVDLWVFDLMPLLG